MFSGNRFRRIWPSVGVVSVLLLGGVIGCGPAEPFEMLPVSGKVTYDDQSLISAARIDVVFAPQAQPIDPKTHPRPGRAAVKVADGTFSEATSHKYGDGLVVGRHKVKVVTYDKNDVPTEHQATPAQIEVGPDSTEFTFTVKR